MVPYFQFYKLVVVKRDQNLDLVRYRFFWGCLKKAEQKKLELMLVYCFVVLIDKMMVNTNGFIRMRVVKVVILSCCRVLKEVLVDHFGKALLKPKSVLMINFLMTR